uniref:Epsin-1 isoform X1 n=1 Tax=Psoroptes ovis TaxID=83912 RepID=A0A3B0QNX9_PSOOV|nr:epsin-1 isoform X1 [Psoroptes ovis]
MSNMLNVQEIRRNVINVVKNYSDAQVKVRNATSNEPWGPSATLMADIADLTYNVVAFSEIMQIIWKRLNDHGKNWRHVYKSLLLLEYLIKTGSEKVAQQCRDNLFAIQTLKDFQYIEDNKDQGMSIREKSKLLVNLLKDEEKLAVERSRALKAKERFSQSMSYMGGDRSDTSNNNNNDQTFRSSTSYPESLSQSDNANSRTLNPELESARPQTAGEEKLQLELALAMSKEEAEQEERLRKNDDLRLKLALEESEKNRQKSDNHSSAGGGGGATSNVDELLSLAGPSTNQNDPWSSAPSTTSNTLLSQPSPVPASLLPSPPINHKSHRNNHHANLHQQQQSQQHNDPWSTPPPTNSNSIDFDKPTITGTAFDDPWGGGGGGSNTTQATNDPWSITTAPTVANNDPWNLNTSTTSATINDKKAFDGLAEPIKTSPVASITSNPVRRTPESFLGPNSNLVNLDALVSSNKVQTSTSPNNNPFASAVPQPIINPFQRKHNKIMEC